MSEETSKYFFINLEYESPERYDLARFMEFVDDNYDPLTSFMFDKIRALKSGGRYIVRGEEDRPDLISYRIYGSSQYWWVILIYNGITSYKDIVHGTEMRYPELQALENLYFSLKAQQTAGDV